MELYKKTKLNILISRALIVLLVYVFVQEIVWRQYLYAIAAVAAIILAFMPAMIERNFRICLPWYLEFLILCALLLHIAGNSFRFYATIPYYDTVTHLLGSAIIAMIAFLWIFVLYFTGKINVSIKMIGLFTFIFTVAVGGLWEIGEFAVDHMLGANAQLTWIDPAKGLYDTNTDLIMDTLAGGIVAIAAMSYVQRQSKKAIQENIGYILDSKQS